MTLAPGLSHRIVAIHEALESAGIPHAFGGALALAYCVAEPRGTADIDVNVFASVDDVRQVFQALPEDVVFDDGDVEMVARDGQVRLRWGEIPVDLFFAYDEFHHEAAARVRTCPFGDRILPFLACTDLAVFKAFFDRPRDWVDIDMAIDAGSVDVDAVAQVLERYLGSEDHRLLRLRRIAAGSEDLEDYGL